MTDENKQEQVKEEVNTDSSSDLQENFAKLISASTYQENERRIIEEEKVKISQEKQEIEKLKRAVENLKSDPLNALGQLGITYNDLVKSAASKQPQRQPQQYQYNNQFRQSNLSDDKINKLERELDNQKKEFERYRQRELAQAEFQLDQLIIQEIKDNDYDVINSLGLSSQVKQKFLASFEDGKDPVALVKKYCKEVNTEVAKAVKKVKGSKWVDMDYDSDSTDQPVIKEEVKAPVNSISNKIPTASNNKKGMTEAEKKEAFLNLMDDYDRKRHR